MVILPKSIRLTGVFPLGGVLQLTLRPSVMEQAFLSEDIPIGASITGTVKNLTPTILIIKI
ncbi:hypothetical protein MJO28_007092 [Puccinia striiformis f. sp. tritici]|uniref:Uncharacterized protein n=1 Tax=Puccinia striiformis f. sp. tritici TaxID=168172 RepID=A0ACC0ECW2_9BASI|nr:hypothetical protein Pst134EA_013197 [Puccinia striiformis f. sp. tritici]KAH9454103.1 hypothetical protein Pst134EB_014198 [Puccinia striiformis f. sp. tritici]KAH9465307.1 hypothetical protein Pst134EA_013197 [Puccinia striiformis f. sp. tritici]KAI7951408.1 hypothetical protein MJO28_007092 [Puccinia striiformis f. sp. tritici]KAI7955649.1 hypothetical protein MJO29_007048 [Puccinia striiformis f. sp. tritici]